MILLFVVDICTDNGACQNGATCSLAGGDTSDNENGYICHCPIGFKGENCEITPSMHRNNLNKTYFLLTTSYPII